jgi:hypothetical protein
MPWRKECRAIRPVGGSRSRARAHLSSRKCCPGHTAKRVLRQLRDEHGAVFSRHVRQACSGVPAHPEMPSSVSPARSPLGASGRRLATRKKMGGNGKSASPTFHYRVFSDVPCTGRTSSDSLVDDAVLHASAPGCGGAPARRCVPAGGHWAARGPVFSSPFPGTCRPPNRLSRRVHHARQHPAFPGLSGARQGRCVRYFAPCLSASCRRRSQP